jgi:hypothetical protein
MSYTYHIIVTTSLQVQETNSRGFFLNHSITELINGKTIGGEFSPVIRKSFLRTKKWVENNHPELLL